MAGSEKMGFTNSQGMLFVGKPWVITPHKNNPAATLQKIEEFITYLGSNVVTLTAEEHDEYAASVSHMVFLLSTYLFAFLYAKHKEALSVAGSGFDSLTRLASGSPSMHTEIISQNYDNITISMVAFMEFIKEHNLANDSLLSFFQNTKSHRDTFYVEKS
jgi:prephenate dehydrogenase